MRKVLRITLVAAVVALSVRPIPGASQALRIDSSSVRNGQSGVPLVDSLYFYFNKKLPFNSLFTSKFVWEPRRSATRRYIFLDADRRAPRFTIEHDPVTDFSVVVFGVQAEDGNRMDRPFLLNYSTASEMGSRRVAGTVSFGERQPPAKVARIGRWIGRSALEDVISVGEALPPGITSGKQSSIEWTVIYVLPQFLLNDDFWTVRSVAGVGTDGSYELDHVRSGTYYPVAVTFGNDEGTTVSAYGYYDPDGDFEPDPVSVGDSDLAGIDFQIFSYEPFTALANRDLADARADAELATQQLYQLSARSVGGGGRALEWRYSYFKAEVGPIGDRALTVTVDPLLVSGVSSTYDEASVPTDLPSAGLLDSDSALQIAELNGGVVFRADHVGSLISVDMSGGNLFDRYPAEPTRPLWWVEYHTDNTNDTLRVVLDMVSGDVVSVTQVSREAVPDAPATAALLGNYPNPVRESTRIRFRLESPGHVALHIYDVLGRRVSTVLDRQMTPGEHSVFWSPADLSAGTYFLRLESDSFRASRALVVTGAGR